MKKVLIMMAALLALTALGAAQSGAYPQPSAPPPQQPPAQPPQAQQPGDQPAPPAAPVKRGPQAKSQAEFDAFQAAANNPDLAAAETAAREFEEKFPDSELTSRLYQELQRRYQDQNDAEKTVEMGRKAIQADAENYLALVATATVLAERTRDTDLDRNERLAESTKYAQKVIDNIDALVLPAEIPPDRAEMAKSILLSMAHGALGTVEFNKENDAAAEKHLRVSTTVNQGEPDAISWLRLAIALDRQSKYGEGLEAANKALQHAPPGPVAELARQERDRLVKLVGPSTPPAGTPTPPAGTTAPPPSTPAPPSPPNTPR